MNAIALLKQMHQEAKSAFQKLEQGEPNQRLAIWDKLQPELVRHEELEETHVYDPVAQAVGDRDQMLRDWELKHHEQADAAKALISKVNMADPLGNEFLGHVRELRTTLEQHITTEENEIFPRIEQMWGAQELDRAGSQIESAWKEFTRGRVEPAA